MSEKNKISSYFGENVFGMVKMSEYVSEETYDAFLKWTEKDKQINKKQADEIANAMKEWAISKGATHYAHWFHPLTGKTAEKHQSFIKFTASGHVIEKFSGDSLIYGESDASSFPNGGLRSTFEARGYTAWDPSSPAFVMETGTGKTLCIPSIFISYTGESLDKKLPLLKSETVLKKEAKDLLALFGKKVKRVFSTCGIEQEYFLIDIEHFRKRQDLLLTGRTLLGASSPKEQQLSDQYFGSIKERILNFMNEVECEAYKYGIPLTTRHNEVAPNQYEFAPIFEKSNLAVDHNQLLMIIMQKIATKHGLACLLAEKPFANVNGSGKHLNWSMSDNTGVNLLEPGKAPEENLQFMVFLVSIIRAVYKYGDLLLTSVSFPGNQHRLGGHEAPPAIISVFLGDFLSNVLEQIESGSVKREKRGGETMFEFDLNKLPSFIKDNTDRNRTSPFAFTGNKFEFRAVGSSQNVATAMTFLNTIVADSIAYIREQIETKTKKTDFNNAVFEVLKEIVKETKDILFEKDNYSDEWRKEAKRRGLYIPSCIPLSLENLTKEKNIQLFEKYNVLKKEELLSRYRIWSEQHKYVDEIELKTLIDMVSTSIIPDITNYRKLLISGIKDVESYFGLDFIKTEKEEAKKYCSLVNDVFANLNELKKISEEFKKYKEIEAIIYSSEKIAPLVEKTRGIVDILEKMTGDEYWSLPKYKEMFFLV